MNVLNSSRVDIVLVGSMRNGRSGSLNHFASNFNSGHDQYNDRRDDDDHRDADDADDDLDAPSRWEP